MELDDLAGKATELLGGEAGVDEKIDQAAAAIQERTPDAADGVVEQLADKAKDIL